MSLFTNLVGQSCGTLSRQEEDEYISSLDCNTTEYYCKKINIYFHILRKKNKKGGIEFSKLVDATIYIQQFYNPHNIKFIFFDYDYIDNTSFYEEPFNESNFNALAAYNKASYLNVYVSNFNGGGNVNGRAHGIPSNSLVIWGDRLNTATFPHEIGHCLGLAHTHRGNIILATKKEGCDESGCFENIDGSNCHTCGDYICDTPSDPCLIGRVNSNCQYTGPSAYNPDVTNLMSYADVCRNKFTSGQANKMHCVIEKSNQWKNVYTKNEDLYFTNFTYPYQTGGGGGLGGFSTTHNNETYEAAKIIKAQNNVLIKSNAKLSFRAGEKIVLGHGFKVEEGASFHAYIAPSSCTKVYNPATRIGNTEVPQDLVSPEVLRKLEDEILLEEKGIRLFPNPSKGHFTIHSKESINAKEIELYDVNGKRLPISITGIDNTFDIMLAYPSPGFYFLRAGAVTEKVIIMLNE